MARGSRLGSGPQTSTGVRTLVVDDEEVFRTTLAKLLGARGMAVGTAASGEECVALLAREAWDVVVLDLKMPGQDGLDTLKRIRQLRPATHVIILTGHGTAAAGLSALQEAADDFLLKPVPIDHLVHVIVAAAQKGDEAP